MFFTDDTVYYTLQMKLVPAVLALLWLSSCASRGPARAELTIAAAANLTAVFQALGPRFESQTGIHPVFSFASTAQLARQIENAAPFDVLAAADATHVDDLDRKGLISPGTRAVYATGILALWIPPQSNATVGRVEDLTSSSVWTIAVANPKLAPYGQASIETLRSLGILPTVQSKIVYAENINMAKQYGASHNSDAVFTAYSLVMHDGGTVIAVDEKLHQPIVQELGVVARSRHQDAARKFVQFLVNGPGRALLRSYGYR